MPRLKVFLKDLPGVAVRDIWIDIGTRLNSAAAERLGIRPKSPKPSSNELPRRAPTKATPSSIPSAVVAPPLCRATPQPPLDRHRYHSPRHRPYQKAPRRCFRRISSCNLRSDRRTRRLKSAEALAKEDPYQFQWWALSLVGARPLEKKKGADQGIDGRLYFHDEKGGKTKQIILSVKAGKLHAPYVRDLRGVIEREKAEIGVLISMEAPTKPMLKEAAEAGFYRSPGLTDRYPRIQILSIEELLAAKKIDYPRFAADATFKKAPKARKAAEEQIPLPGEIDDPF